MTPLITPTFGQLGEAPLADQVLAGPADDLAKEATGPPGLQALCEAVVDRHLAAFTAPLAGLSEQELRRRRPRGPFDALPPPLADRLTARLLRRRSQLAELPLLYALTSPRQTTAHFTGKAAGARVRAVALQLRAPGLRQLVCEVSCDCDGAGCDDHAEIVRLAAGSHELRSFVDDSQHRLSGAELHRLLDQCPQLEQLSVRLGGARELRAGADGRSFPNLRQLAVVCRSACFDTHALSRLFPGLRQLSLTNEADWREQRCQCRFCSSTQLGRLETAQLDGVCPTAAAALRAGARSLHTLRLRGCCLTPLGGKLPAAGAARRRSFRDAIAAVLRRKLITLPNIQIRRLEVRAAAVDAALVNANFPCLKALQVDCAELRVDAEKVAAAPLWFPCLERLEIRLSGPGPAEPAVLARPLPRLTEYAQSFGSLRLSRLAAACPRLERLSLDPVLLEDAAPLPAVRQLTVSWCGSGSLARMAEELPALERLRVLDPPFLDRRRWQELEQQLSGRGVQVELEW